MREKIIQKATELYLTLGFKSVTMDDIANALGISKKTIYVHFSNKTKLVEAVTFEVFETVCDGIDSIYNSSQNSIQELYDIKIFVIQYLKDEKTSPQYQLKKYYPQIYQRLHIKQFKKMHDSVKKSLQKGIETELYRPNINIDFISRMYFNGMTGIKEDAFFPPDLYNIRYLMESFLEYHIRAIATKKGIEELEQQIINNKQNQ